MNLNLRLPLVLFFLAVFGQTFAQEESDGYQNSFWLKWGLNSGVAWQTSDVDCRLGPGWGTTLEVPLIQSRRGNIVLGLRGRYLWTRTFGQDWQIDATGTNSLNPGINGTLNPDINYVGQDYIANHRTSTHELGGELNLTFQPPYNQPGWFFGIYGGLNGERFKVDMDHRDIFGQYDYSTISQASKGDARRDLRDMYSLLRDWDQTAWNDGRPRWVFAPSAGFDMGYRVSRGFYVGWGYKITFPQTDFFDGELSTGGRNAERPGKDIYHYTNLGLGFTFGGGTRTTTTTTHTNTGWTSASNPPSISVLYPGTTHRNITGNCESDFRIRIRNVSRKSDIRVSINNRTVPPGNYDFDPSSGYLTFRGYLNRGSNTVVITATNRDGSDSETIRLTCSQQMIAPPTNEVMTVCVPVSATRRETRVINTADWPYYQSIGAVPGPCPQVQQQIAICVFDPNSPTGSQTLLIPQSEWGYYQSIGASMGACSNRTITICTTDPHNPTVRYTTNISETAWPWFQSQGAVRGPCPSLCSCVTICMVDPAAPGGARTLTITQAEWPQYQAMGAVLGPCNENEMLICYKEPCSNQDPQTLLIKESAWPYYQQRGATIGPCPDPTIEVCLPDENAPGGSRTIVINENEWPRYQAMGASWGRCSTRMITICYPTGNGQRVTMTISESAWFYYQDRGAIRGVCPPSNMAICMPDPNAPNGSRTMTISETEWPYYQAQGATQGNCSGATTLLCWTDNQGNPTEIRVSNTVVNYYTSRGATRGPCPPQQMTICLPDPNAPNGSRTLVINQNQWAQYQSQGAVQGPCGNANMTICVQPGTEAARTITIPSSLWSWYQAQGAVQGSCQPPMVTVCMPDPNSATGSSMLSVPQSQLQFYLNQGAVQGPCSGNTIKICWDNPNSPGNKEELTIPENLWSWYQSRGAVRGTCPEEQIKICLPDPLNVNGGRTLTINLSEWPRYQAMGAVQGQCAGQMTICLPTGNPPVNTTTTIFANLWPHYQAQGAIQGPCPEPTVTICMPNPNSPNGSQTMTIPQSELANYIERGATRGPCSGSLMTICMPAGRGSREAREMVISSTAWQYYQSQGATQGPCPNPKIKICLPDPNSISGGRTLEISEDMWPQYQAQGAVRGDCGTNFIEICFKRGARNTATIMIPEPLWSHYAELGATRGPCKEPTPVVDSIKICMPDPTSPTGGTQMTIAEKDFASYQSRGAVRGNCGEAMTICLPGGLRSRRGQNVTIPANLWPHYQGLGATQGECPEVQVQICMPDPTHPNGGKTMSIPQNELQSYISRGAVEGPCPSGTTTVCWPDPTAPQGKRTLSVPTALLSWYLNNGATEGECPEATMLICVPDPNAPGGSREMTVTQSMVDNYLQNGASIGRCDGHTTTICFNDATIAVSNSVLAWYTENGGEEGACPEPQITICLPDSNQPGGSQELTIAESQWNSYQTQGAVRGPCDNGQTTICLNGTTHAVSNTVLNWYMSNGATTGACPEPTMTICLPDSNATNGSYELTINQSQWPIFQAQGAIQGPCSVDLQVICVNGQDLQVSTTLLSWYLNNGAQNGPCPEPTMTICVPDANSPNGSQELTITQSQWANYQAQGAVQGPCDGGTQTICYQGQTIQVSPTVYNWYMNNGATDGECQAQTITICLPDANSPNGSQQLTINQSQWGTYQAQGATQGSCSGSTQTVCYQGNTMQVSSTVYNWYMNNGATDGQCQSTPTTITICLPDANSPNGSQELTINQSQWATYQAQGAVQGPCDGGTQVICYQDQTMMVSPTVYNWYMNNGATDGECQPQTITICLPDANAPNGSQQLTINQSQWATYQAQGATQGSCSGTTATICYNGSNFTVSTTVRDWYLNNGATNGPCSSGNSGTWDRSSVSVSGHCNGNTAEFDVTNTGQAGQGDMLGPTAYRFYENNQLVYTGSIQLTGGQTQTLTRTSNGVPIKLEVDQRPGHPGNSQPRETVSCGGGGDRTGGEDGGETGKGENIITICNVPPSNPRNPQTLQIKESDWAKYSNTATRGACDMRMVEMCIDGKDDAVPAPSVSYFEARGGKRGKCPEKTITICHVPPSNPSQPKTLTIKESEWTRYSREATKGECDMGRMTICYNSSTMQIPRASWSWYSNAGAREGECRAAQITICNVPPGNPSSPETIQIKETDWARYSRQAHRGNCNTTLKAICYNNQTMRVPQSSWDIYYSKQGAKEGSCPTPMITICHVPPSNPSQPKTLEIKETEWNRYSSEATRGGCNMRSLTICYRNQTMTVPQSSWDLFYSKNGAKQGECPKPKITICNVPPSNPSAPQTISIEESEWTRYARQAHKGNCNTRQITICYNNRTMNVPQSSWDVYYSKQGAKQGECPKPKISICNVPPNNPSAPQNLQIEESEWSRYASQAHRGNCNMRQLTICYSNRTMNVPQSSWDLFYSKKGARQGECPKPKISICNVPPSNPSAPQNIQIEESQWTQYARQAHKGSCNMTKITICYNGKTMSVPNSSWNVYYSKQGAKQGACPPPMISICHVPPASPAAPKNITIKETDWARYSKEAHRGNCNMTKKTICYGNKTMSVPVSSWNIFYSKKGGKEGACPPPPTKGTGIKPGTEGKGSNLLPKGGGTTIKKGG